MPLLPTLARSGVAAAVAVAALALPGSTGAAPVDPQPGAPGVGDPYFPLDGNGGIDVLRYEVHDAYALGAHRLSGWTRLDVRATEDLSSFHLDLLLPVLSARVDGVRADVTRAGSHELVLTPATPLAAGARFTVTVAYAGRPGRVGYRGEHPWLASDHEVVAVNEPHMAPWWFPADDHPSDKAVMDLRLRVRRGATVVANGVRRRPVADGRHTTYHWISTEPMAPSLAFFAAGDLRVEHGTTDGLPWWIAVSRRLPPAARADALRLMRTTPRDTAWLAHRLGPYPFAATGGLTTALPVGFALETQTRPTFPAMGAGHDAGLTVVHELAHQWFGDSVSVADWRDVWLNEGPATFMEHAWVAAHGGPDLDTWLLQAYAGQPADAGFWSVPVVDPGPELLFSWPVYERGAMTLAALRHRIGDAAFWRLLRRWLADHRHGNGSTADFEALAGEVAGQDLSGFFDAWLRTPSRPARTPANGF